MLDVFNYNRKHCNYNLNWPRNTKWKVGYYQESTHFVFYLFRSLGNRHVSNDFPNTNISLCFFIYIDLAFLFLKRLDNFRNNHRYYSRPMCCHILLLSMNRLDQTETAIFILLLHCLLPGDCKSTDVSDNFLILHRRRFSYGMTSKMSCYTILSLCHA